MNSKDYKPLTDGNFAIETPSVFDSTECNRIIDSAKNFNQGGIQGKNGLEGSIKKDTSKVRKVKTFFDNQDWVYDRIWPIMEDRINGQSGDLKYNQLKLIKYQNTK